MPYNPDGSFTPVYSFGTGTAPNNMFPPQVGTTVSDMATSIAIPNIVTQAAFISVIAATIATKAGLTQTDFISGLIAVPAVKGYWLVLGEPLAINLTHAGYYCVSGTCVVHLAIDGVGTVAGSSQTVSSSYGNYSLSSASMGAGQSLYFVVDSNSSSTDLSFRVDYTETLAQ